MSDLSLTDRGISFQATPGDKAGDVEMGQMGYIAYDFTERGVKKTGVFHAEKVGVMGDHPVFQITDGTLGWPKLQVPADTKMLSEGDRHIKVVVQPK